MKCFQRSNNRVYANISRKTKSDISKLLLIKILLKTWFTLNDACDNYLAVCLWNSILQILTIWTNKILNSLPRTFHDRFILTEKKTAFVLAHTLERPSEMCERRSMCDLSLYLRARLKHTIFFGRCTLCQSPFKSSNDAKNKIFEESEKKK